LIYAFEGLIVELPRLHAEPPEGTVFNSTALECPAELVPGDPKQPGQGRGASVAVTPTAGEGFSKALGRQIERGLSAPSTPVKESEDGCCVPFVELSERARVINGRPEQIPVRAAAHT
jgi:hypothetical protein